MKLIPRYEDAAYEPSGAGLLLLAETELALEKPMTRLRQAYGDDVQFDPPVVRYERGSVLMEPHMGLRVICNPQHFAPVRRDLALRGALLLDAEVTEQFGVLRASAPLAALIGYPQRLEALTDPRTKLVMWLSHYAAAPSGGDAA